MRQDESPERLYAGLFSKSTLLFPYAKQVNSSLTPFEALCRFLPRGLPDPSAYQRC